MNDEIKEILDELESMYEISELEQQIKDIEKIKNRITNLQKENERLKTALNCKEYFSSTMPEDTEFVILTKNNYDRQQKDIQFELIDYKSRCEKASDNLKRNYWINEHEHNDDVVNMTLNILQNGSDSQ